MDLTNLDVLLLFENFESSKCKLWETIRRYKPIHIAALLYILENLIANKSVKCVQVDDLQIINKFPSPVSVKLTLYPEHVNFSRPQPQQYTLFNNDNQSKINRIIKINDFELNDSFTKLHTVVDLLNIIKNNEFFDYTILDNLKIDKSTKVETFNNILTRIVLFNCTTADWQKFIHYMVFQLFPDNLQITRYDNISNISNKSKSIVNSFLRYYKMFTSPQSFDTINSMDLKYMILPKPQTTTRELIYKKMSKYITQPYYQGFYIIINVSDTSVRFYNRWSEPLIFSQSIQRAISEATKYINCTLISILLPKDEKNHLRSWRYWQYRASFEIKIIDIIRFKSKNLISVPLIERLKYLDNIEATKFVMIENATDQHVDTIETDYYECQMDCYSAKIGVIIKHPQSLLSNNSKIFSYKFPLKNAFDLCTNKIVTLKSDYVNTNKYKLYFNPELAQYYTTVMVYNHDTRWFYICHYNINIHQFQHYCRFQRELSDKEDPKYMINEKILVIDSPFNITRGVFYLRIYYNDNKEYLGYDRKYTSSRYDLPLTYEFFN